MPASFLCNAKEWCQEQMDSLEEQMSRRVPALSEEDRRTMCVARNVYDGIVSRVDPDISLTEKECNDMKTAVKRIVVLAMGSNEYLDPYIYAVTDYLNGETSELCLPERR